MDEYRRDIETDPALERRFQLILVPEPGVEDTVAILHGLRDRYEAHHQVRFTDEALDAVAAATGRRSTSPSPAISHPGQHQSRAQCSFGHAIWVIGAFCTSCPRQARYERESVLRWDAIRVRIGPRVYAADVWEPEARHPSIRR